MNGKTSASGLGDLLHERPMKQPLDKTIRQRVLDWARRRSSRPPLAVECEWHSVEPVLSVKSKLATMNVAFDSERMAVYARMPLATRMLATEANRTCAIGVIEEIADELDL